MSIENNGRIGQELQMKTIAANVNIPIDYEPALAITILIDKAGKVFMDAPWDQLSLVLHLANAGLNTAIGMTQQRLQTLQKEQSLIVPPGTFRA